MADDPRYGRVAIALHWLLALAIVGTFGVGFVMDELPVSPLRIRVFNWHKWAGITILALSALRLLWRLGHRPPPLPDAVLRALPGWQRTASALTHGALYVLFFAVPLSGWAFSSASGFPIAWFGVLPLPDWVPVDKPLAESFYEPLHQACAYVLGALVALHVLAALKHRLVDRDAVLERMWPRRARTR